ncbi:MAG: tetratricopeptide repeat protein [Phycisphaerales bacterium]
MIPTTVVLSVLLSAAALVAPPKKQKPPEPPPPEPEPRPVFVVPGPEQPMAFGEEVRRLWASDDFQRVLALSYQADSDVEPKVNDLEKPQLYEVLKLIAAEKPAEALAMVDPLCKDDASAVFDFTKANIHFQLEDFDNAGEAYAKATAKFPKFRRAWRNLALIHVRKGDFAKAIVPLTRLVELNGADSVVYGLLGYAYSLQDDNLGAESAYRMALLLDPKSKDWQLGLARTFFKQERWADAIALTQRLISEKPDQPDLWLLQANAFIGSGQAMKAAQNYEIVARMGKATADSTLMLGDIYVNEELYGPAVDCYARALAMTPRPTAERTLRAAKVILARGALADGRRLVESTAKTFGEDLTVPERKEMLKLRSRIAAATQATDEQARVLAQIIELDPLDGEALMLLGQYHTDQGDLEKAVFHYERAASVEKFEADAKVRHAQVLVKQGKYGDAVPLLRAAQQVRPRDNVQTYLDQVERAAKGR